jgi:hypothetical protein
MPSSANDASADGLGTGTATGVSENWFVRKARIPGLVTETASVTVRLVVAAKVVLALGVETEAERDLPFESVSVSANDPGGAVPKSAREASVIGSLEGAVTVYEIEPLRVTPPTKLNPKFSPGSFVVSTGLTDTSDAGRDPLLVKDTPEIVLSSTVHVAFVPPER